MAELRRRIEPSQLKKRRRRRKNIKLIFWAISFALIIFGASFATHLSAFNIRDITIEGNSLVSSDDLKQMIKTNLVGNYFLVFSKSNIFLYPKAKIKNDILNQYKSIESVTIKDSSFHGIDLAVKERKSQALWCANPGTNATSSGCYFIDDQGYIFYPALDFSGNVYFIYYGLINADNPVGQNYLGAEEFQGLTNFLSNIKKLGIDPVSLKAVDNNDLELNLSSGVRILFSTSQPFDQTLYNLETIIDKNNPSGVNIDLSTVDYIDLRFGNKVFYKLKGSSASGVSTSTASSN